jgi:predicted transcriptional regulator of viral defense system
MARRKTKSVSFDAMVKFFMHNYQIPTTKDVEKLMSRLDQIEKLIKSATLTKKGRRIAANKDGARKPRTRGESSAIEQVLEVIRGLKQGADLPEIKSKTEFDDKKVRNIIYRLHKDGSIERISRGVYRAK